MKNIIKMSLVAAVAVAGLTTTSSAANLEDAVKNTKMAGYVRYRLETNHEGNSEANEKTKAVFKFTTPVNDTVTSNVKIVAGEASTENGDTTASMKVTEANFVVKAGSATIIAGLQTSQSPFFANNGDTRSHGVTALIPAGAATIAAAHYTTTVPNSVDATKDISALGAIGNFAGVNAEAWYAQINKTDITAMAVLASGKAGPVAISAHHAEVDTDTDGVDITNTQVAVSAKAGMATITAAYATTGDTSGDVTVDGDTDSKLIFAGEILSTKTGSLDAMVLSIGAKVSSAVSVGLLHISGEVADTVDVDETKLSVGYKMSKNFKVSGWYATGDNGTDQEKSRIEVKYTF